MDRSGAGKRALEEIVSAWNWVKEFCRVDASTCTVPHSGRLEWNYGVPGCGVRFLGLSSVLRCSVQ